MRKTMKHDTVPSLHALLLLVVMLQTQRTAGSNNDCAAEYSNTLYFTSPAVGANMTHVDACLNRATVHDSDEGLASTIRPHTVMCPTKRWSDLRQVKSIAYDGGSGVIMLHLTSDDDSRFTLVSAAACSPPSGQVDNASLSNHTDSAVETSPDPIQVLYDDAKAVDNGFIGPFAVHNDTIYFVLQRLEHPDFRTRQNVIELRRMAARCKDGSPMRTPITATSSNFDLLECSLVVSNIVTEVYETERETYRPLDSLLIISDGDTLEFYVQLQRITNITSQQQVDVTVELYRVVRGAQADDVISCDVIHRHRVADVTYIRYLLVQLGGISHSHDVLCWAPVDSVLCARMSRSKGHDLFNDVQTVVNSNQVEQVCQAPASTAQLRHVITGVAIATASGRLQLYFGCTAQTPIIGGAGLVRMRADDFLFRSGQVVPVRTAESPLFAGSMFVIDREARSDRDCAIQSSAPMVLSIVILCALSATSGY